MTICMPKSHVNLKKVKMVRNLMKDMYIKSRTYGKKMNLCTLNYHNSFRNTHNGQQAGDRD